MIRIGRVVVRRRILGLRLLGEYGGKINLVWGIPAAWITPFARFRAVAPGWGLGGVPRLSKPEWAWLSAGALAGANYSVPVKSG